MPTRADARSRTRWAGVPAADRRGERRRLLLDAALELLGTVGWAGTGVRSVCQAARLNPRYFYESFATLDELVVAVYDRLVDQLRGEVAAAVREAGADPADRVRAAVDTTVRFVDEDRRRARILYVEALGNEALNRRRIETGFAITDLVAEDVAQRQHPAGTDEALGRMTAAVLVGGFSELLMAWLDGRIAIDRDGLVDGAAALFLSLGTAGRRGT